MARVYVSVCYKGGGGSSKRNGWNALSDFALLTSINLKADRVTAQ